MNGHNNTFKWLTLLGTTATLLSVSEARTIQWGSSVGDINIESDGTPLTAADFTFELGSFGGSFAPDASNTDLWAANWQVLDTANYNEPIGFFSSSFTLADNSTFAVGEQAFIWVHNGTGTGTNEWALITNYNLNQASPMAEPWLIPAADPTAPAIFWWRVSASDATEVGTTSGTYIGDPINPADDVNYTIQTQAVTIIPEPSSALLLIFGGLGLLMRRQRN